MSSSKRRKLDVAPQLSAFAAKSLRSQKNSPGAGSLSQAAKAEESLAVSIKRQPLSSDNRANDTYGGDATPKRVGDLEQDIASEDDPDQAFDSEEGALNSSFLSRAGSPGNFDSVPSIVLSTFRPNKGNVKEIEGGSLSLKVAPGERLVILGEYVLSVQKGCVSLLGATLGPSRNSYRVFAPSTHSLPVLRCVSTAIDDAEIKIRQCNSGIGLLKPLSSLFGKLWNDDTGALGSQFAPLLKGKKRSSFQIVYSSKDAPQKTYLQPVIATPEWNQALAKFPTPGNQKAPVIIICGPKGSGKSTFAKLLMNRLLSRHTGINPNRPDQGATNSPGLAVLDLDPGQPEFSVQGLLSLIHLTELNFGPPFTHPIPDSPARVVRSHTVGAVSPSFNPALYIACVLDLFAHYRNMLSTVPKCPLVINTPGWILGTGLEILVELIKKCRPTEVIYMSQDGPQEVVEALREAAKTTPVITLPSQGSEYTTRTAAHLRTMQAMSYFHLNRIDQDRLTWDDRPLASVPPWEIKYSGEASGILGIMCYGEQPPPSLLLEAINGSLLAVVVVEDKSAIPGWDASPEDGDPEDGVLKALNPSDLLAQSRQMQTPLILHTPNENIPYLNPANAISLSPKHSHCLGLALLRGVDVPRQRLQIITPISPKVIQEINDEGKSIVLVSGKFDTPGWAYIEELVQSDVNEKESRKTKSGDSEGGLEGDEGTLDMINKPDRKQKGVQDVPWVGKLQGSQGRGIGARVWRVRRDLGRDAGGE